MIRKIMEKIGQSVSGERVFNGVKEIANYHRIQASPGYRAAAHHIRQQLTKEGFNAAVRSYPADGSTWFFTSKMFREWEGRAGVLDLVEPQKRLADFSANNMCLIQRSYPCDYRDQPLEIVLMDKGSDPQNYAGVDLKGKLLFIRQNFHGFMDWAIKEKGAVGFITDVINEMPGVRARADLYDVMTYTSFWWRQPDEPPTFGFVLTPRMGDFLAQVCLQKRAEHEKDPSKEMYPRATAFIDAGIYDGSIEVVETVLPGETDEELLIVAHLCHPRSSANDNASGVAAGMEAVRVLKGLTETGQLARLKRGIRVIFVPEFTGTYAYLHELGGARGKIKAGINLDMVGGRQAHGYGPITISGLPHANPSFVVDLAALVMDEARRNQPAQGKDNTSAMFNGKVGSFETGSDHYVLSDPTINIPSIMLGQWPDKFYHTSGDTPEVVDPFILHKSTTICAGYIYLLANLALEDVPLILNKSVERLTEELGELVKRGAGKQMESGLLYRKMQHLTEFYKGCNRSLAGFFNPADEPALQTRIERTNKLLEQTADTLWIGYVDAFAPGFEVMDEPVPAVYRYVPVRKYVTPVSHLDDHALGDPQKLAACKDHTKNHAAKLHSAHYFDGVVQFYIDGQRSLWEIAQEAMLETGDGSVEYVERFVKLLASLDLVEIQ